MPRDMVKLVSLLAIVVVRDGIDVCSTQPSRLADAFVCSVKFLEKSVSVQKLKGLFFLCKNTSYQSTVQIFVQGCVQKP